MYVFETVNHVLISNVNENYSNTMLTGILKAKINKRRGRTSIPKLINLN